MQTLQAGDGAVGSGQPPGELLLQLVQLRVIGVARRPCRRHLLAQGLVLVLQGAIDDGEGCELALQLLDPAAV